MHLYVPCIIVYSHAYRHICADAYMITQFRCIDWLSLHTGRHVRHSMLRYASHACVSALAVRIHATHICFTRVRVRSLLLFWYIPYDVEAPRTRMLMVTATRVHRDICVVRAITHSPCARFAAALLTLYSTHSCT